MAIDLLLKVIRVAPLISILWLLILGLAIAQPVSAPEYAGGIPFTASATGTTGATSVTINAATADAQGRVTTIHLCGFSILANATAASTGAATVTGLVTGTMTFEQWTAAAASGIGRVEPPFGMCIRAASSTTNVVITSAAPGTGGNVTVNAWGYYSP